MQRQSRSTRTILVLFIGLFAIGFTAVAQTAAAGEHGYRCSNRTLSGDYGCSVQGVLLNVPNLPPEAQFVGVTTSHFDGAGNVTGKEHVVVNGMSFNPGWDANQGTYSVNSDCTARATVITPNSPAPLDLYLVIVDYGREFRQVLNSSALVTVCRRLN